MRLTFDGDLLWFRIFRLRQNHGEHAVCVFRHNVLLVDLTWQGHRAGKAAGGSFNPMEGFTLLFGREIEVCFSRWNGSCISGEIWHSVVCEMSFPTWILRRQFLSLK